VTQTSVRYQVARASVLPELAGPIDDPLWQAAEVGAIEHFHGRTLDFRPDTEFRVLHDGEQLAVRFEVDDRYVRTRCTTLHGSVCVDACVEFFFEPIPGYGYFNLEVNSGGTPHLGYHDHDRDRHELLPEDLMGQLEVYGSTAPVVEPEVTEPMHWFVDCRIPMSIVHAYLPEAELAGAQWRGNFYKCATANSHPHWAYWSPMNGKLSFHRPKYFSPIHFEA